MTTAYTPGRYLKPLAVLVLVAPLLLRRRLGGLAVQPRYWRQRLAPGGRLVAVPVVACPSHFQPLGHARRDRCIPLDGIRKPRQQHGRVARRRRDRHRRAEHQVERLSMLRREPNREHLPRAIARLLLRTHHQLGGRYFRAAPSRRQVDRYGVDRRADRNHPQLRSNRPARIRQHQLVRRADGNLTRQGLGLDGQQRDQRRNRTARAAGETKERGAFVLRRGRGSVATKVGRDAGED